MNYIRFAVTTIKCISENLTIKVTTRSMKLIYIRHLKNKTHFSKKAHSVFFLTIRLKQLLSMASLTKLINSKNWRNLPK